MTETGTAASVTESAGRIRALLARRYGPSVVLLEHYPVPEFGEGAETLDLVRVGAMAALCCAKIRRVALTCGSAAVLIGYEGYGVWLQRLAELADMSPGHSHSQRAILLREPPYAGDVRHVRVQRCAGRMMCAFAGSALARPGARPAWGRQLPRAGRSGCRACPAGRAHGL